MGTWNIFSFFTWQKILDCYDNFTLLIYIEYIKSIYFCTSLQFYTLGFVIKSFTQKMDLLIKSEIIINYTYKFI